MSKRNSERAMVSSVERGFRRTRLSYPIAVPFGHCQAVEEAFGCSRRGENIGLLEQTELSRERPYFFGELAKFLLKINLALVRGPPHVHGHPLGRWDDLCP